MAVLLLGIALVLLLGHDTRGLGGLPSGAVRTVIGMTAGLGIGIVAALLGVAGGELLIPTLVLIFGADVKLAGSLSLVVSLPTMLTAFSRYTRDSSFTTVRTHRWFLAATAAGSIAGSAIGGRLVQFVPAAVLLPALSLLLVASAVKLWLESKTSPGGEHVLRS